MDFYDPESILADEERVKVKFDHEISDFGFYVSPNTAAIRRGARADLPVFLVRFLLKNGFCTRVDSVVDSAREELRAAPALVDLRGLHFFEVESQFEHGREVADIFYERMGANARLVLKSDFSEEDARGMSYEEKRYLMGAWRWLKTCEDYYFRKLREAV